MQMERKKKTCKVCQKERFIFSKGRCKGCSNIEYQQKSKQRLIEKAKTEKPKPKKQTERHKVAKDAERVAMEVFWNTQTDIEGKAYCQECLKLGYSNEWSCLGSTFNPYNVAHIISKGANPAFRCDLRNFILLCAEHHNQFDAGKRTEMQVYEQTESVRQLLKSGAND
jgi:hypothetical protein